MGWRFLGMGLSMFGGRGFVREGVLVSETCFGGAREVRTPLPPLSRGQERIPTPLPPYQGGKTHLLTNGVPFKRGLACSNAIYCVFVGVLRIGGFGRKNGQ